MWEAFVELLRASIFTTASICSGSLGAGIVLVSAGVRLALLPLTLRLARQAREQQRRMLALKPVLDALRARYAKDPQRLFRETMAVQRKHGIRLLTPAGLVGMAVQLPILGGVFAAVRSGLGARVRFLWVADLARPDAILLAAVVVLGGAALATAPAAPGQPALPSATWIIAGGATLLFLWSASSAVALSVGAGSLISMLQNRLLARGDRR